MFKSHGLSQLYSIRKLQDWTSNQLYRWRAALKKGQAPPRPALRQHIANTAERPDAKSTSSRSRRRSAGAEPEEDPPEEPPAPRTARSHPSARTTPAGAPGAAESAAKDDVSNRDDHLLAENQAATPAETDGRTSAEPALSSFSLWGLDPDDAPETLPAPDKPQAPCETPVLEPAEEASSGLDDADEMGSRVRSPVWEGGEKRSPHLSAQTLVRSRDDEEDEYEVLKKRKVDSAPLSLGAGLSMVSPRPVGLTRANSWGQLQHLAEPPEKTVSTILPEETAPLPELDTKFESDLSEWGSGGTALLTRQRSWGAPELECDLDSMGVLAA